MSREASREAGELLRRALEARRWTPQDLVAELNRRELAAGRGERSIDPTYVAAWISGERGMSTPYAEKVGDVLGIPAELLHGDKRSQRAKARTAAAQLAQATQREMTRRDATRREVTQSQEETPRSGPEPAAPPDDGRPGERQPKPRFRVHRRPVALAVAAALLLVAAAAAWKVASGPGLEPIVHVAVTANTDSLVLTPELAQVAGSYVTALPIERVPPPPGRRDSCSNRYAWAHGTPINAVDAEASVAKVDVTALGGAITITGAGLHYDNDKAAPLSTTQLTCPGRGGQRPPHLLEIDLDSGGVVYYPDGGDVPGNLNHGREGSG